MARDLDAEPGQQVASDGRRRPSAPSSRARWPARGCRACPRGRISVAPDRSAWPGRGRVTGGRRAPVCLCGGIRCRRAWCSASSANRGSQSSTEIGPPSVWPLTHARQDLRGVGFDGHAPATAVAALSPAQVRGNRVEIEVESRGHAVEHGHERLAVRFAGSEKSQHRGSNCRDRNSCPPPRGFDVEAAKQRRNHRVFREMRSLARLRSGSCTRPHGEWP